MRYKNTRTGAIIETASAISGGDWQEITPAVAPKPSEVKVDAPTKATAAKKESATKKASSKKKQAGKK